MVELKGRNSHELNSQQTDVQTRTPPSEASLPGGEFTEGAKFQSEVYAKSLVGGVK